MQTVEVNMWILDHMSTAARGSVPRVPKFEHSDVGAPTPTEDECALWKDTVMAIVLADLVCVCE